MKIKKLTLLTLISIAATSSAFAADYGAVTNSLGKRIAAGTYFGKDCEVEVEFSPANQGNGGGFFEVRIGADGFTMEPGVHVEASNIELGDSGDIVVQSVYRTLNEYLPPISWGNKNLQNDFRAEFNSSGKLSKVTISEGHEHQSFGIVTASTSSCELN